MQRGTALSWLVVAIWSPCKSWKNLYQNYKPGKWYWESVIVARKFLIALCSLMFRQVGAYQLAMCLLVLFIAFVLQTQHLPYITHQNKQTIIDDHVAKALAGDALHSTIENEMRATEKKNTRKRQKQNMFENLVARGAKTKDVSTLVVLFVFDANTVESILLASAILVNLAGVMLDSQRFAGDNFYVNQNEYTALAIGNVFVVAITIAYYVLAIVLELLTVFAPQSMGPLIGCLGICFRSCGRKALQAAAIKASQGKHGKSVRPSSMGPTSGMQVNPWLLKKSAMLEDPSFDESGMLDPEQIAKIDMPTNAMWRAVQGSYGKLVAMMTSMQAELRDLKRGAGISASSNEPNMGEKQLRSRTQFRPVILPEEDSEAVGATAATGNPMAGGHASGALSLATFRGPAVGAHLKGMKRRASAGGSALASGGRSASAAAAAADAAAAAGPEEGIQLVGLLPEATVDVRPRAGPADGVRSARLTTFKGNEEISGDAAEREFAGVTSPRDAAGASEHLLLAARP